MANIESVKLPDNSEYNLKDSASGYAEELSTLENVYGSKNLNAYPYWETTKAAGGLTFTDNGDGSVTVSAGTASSEVSFTMHVRAGVSADKNRVLIPNGTYIASGCPSGGSASTYYIRYGRTSGGTFSEIGKETGSDLTLVLNGDDYNADCVQLQAVITISSGTVISAPKTFYPMIRDSRISDGTYVSPAMTNRELTEKLTGLISYVDQTLPSQNISGGDQGTWSLANYIPAGHVLISCIPLRTNNKKLIFRQYYENSAYVTNFDSTTLECVLSLRLVFLKIS